MLSKLSSSRGGVSKLLRAGLRLEHSTSVLEPHHAQRISSKCVSTSPVPHQEVKGDREEHIIRSPYGSNPIPNISFCEFLFPYFEKHGQKTFAVDGITGKSYTFHEALRCCQKVGAALKKLGLQKGDIVGIYSVNRPEFIIAWLAVLSVGGIVTEVNPNYTAGELIRQLQETGAKMLFTGDEGAVVAKESIKRLPKMKKCVVFGEADGLLLFDELMKEDMNNSLENVLPSQISHIPYSSGTSGLPKGVLVSHSAVIGATLSTVQKDICVSTSEDTCLLLLPLFHTFATFLTWSNIVTGCSTVTLPRFTPESLLGTIQKYRATFVPLVPPLVMFLIQSPLVNTYDLSSVKNIVSGAAPISTEHLIGLIEKMKLNSLRQGYGMTELCPISMPPVKKDPNVLLDSVGKPTAGVEIKIVDTTNGQSLRIGQRGEIYARSNYTMTGYFGNKEATENTIDKQGWLHTGDVGFFSEEGNLYVVDRLKELIKYKGHQVAPAELEALLQTHSNVKDAAVIGVPDESAGELPKAFVVLENPGIAVTEKEIEDFVSGQSSDEKHLRGGVTFLDQIPKSASGKILRRELRKLLQK